MSALLTPTETTAFVLRPEEYERVVLHSVGWAEYEMIGQALRERGNLRLTYDRGELEIMVLSSEHERLKGVLGRLIDVLLVELDLRGGSFGSMTCKRPEERGFEPDECFYLANFDRVRGLDRIEFHCDPAPDLAIEIDITSSSIPRLPLYARVGVPEVWRWEADTVRVYTLAADGQYVVSDTSTAFAPDFPVGELRRFAEIGRANGYVAMVRAFQPYLRKWLTARGVTG